MSAAKRFGLAISVGALVLGVVLFLTSSVAAVQFHRVAMWWWRERDPDALDRHQESLIALGYLQKREFAVAHSIYRERDKSSRNFQSYVERAQFYDKNWRFGTDSTTPGVVAVTAYVCDLDRWQQILTDWDNGF